MNTLQALAGGMLLAGVLAIAAAIASRGKHPAIAHVLWVLVLVKLLLPPFVDAPIIPAVLEPSAGTSRTGHDAVPGPLVHASPGPLSPAGPDGDAGGAPAAITPRGLSAPIPGDVAPPPRAESATRWIVPALLWLWALGSIAVGSVSIARLVRFHRGLRSGRSARASTVDTANALARELGLRRAPDVVVVAARIPPLLWAVGRTRVVLPEQLEAAATPIQIRAVLAHELAHLLRRDHWVRWIELAATIVWWWFPILWWARREMRAVEEECCDAWAVWALEGDGVPCADVVLRTMDLLASGGTPVPVPVAASGLGSVRVFERRLTMMFRSGVQRRLRLHERAIIVLVAVAMLPVAVSWAAISPQDAGTQGGPSPSKALDAMGVPPGPAKMQKGDTPIVTIDGVVLRASDLARELLAYHRLDAENTLIARRVLEHEIAARRLVITGEQVEAEAARLLADAEPSAGSWSAFASAYPATAGELRAVARDRLAWGTIAGADKSDTQTRGILTQLEVRKALDRHKTRRRSAGDSLPEGAGVELIGPDGTVETITEAEILQQLRPTLRLPQLIAAREALIDDFLLGRALEAKGLAVAEKEVRGYVDAMTAKYKPPFDWRMICQFKMTTTSAEVAVFRRLTAWKATTGFTPSEAETKRFFEDRIDYFRGDLRNVSQIVVRTVDLAGNPLDAAKEAEAEKRIHEIRRLVEEGMDFGTLAETQSDDRASAKAHGVLGTPIKRYGSGPDAATRAAVFALRKVGDVTPPVKSADSWRIYKLDKIQTGTQAADLAMPNWAEWVQDELERTRLAAYVETLRTNAKIVFAADAALWSGM